MAKKKERQATVEDVKELSVEPAENKEDKNEENKGMEGMGIAPAQNPDHPVNLLEANPPAKEVVEEQRKDTPKVDIRQEDGKVVAVDVGTDENTFADHFTVGDGKDKEELAEENKGGEVDPELERLQAEVDRLNDVVKSRDEALSEKDGEIEALRKEILESPAEKYRAELEVARREYEVLAGSVQQPRKQIFG